MPKIVSVYAFRRGTGKSNLVANLAVSMAYQGQRIGIIDTDPQSSLHALFGLDEGQLDRTLNYYLWSEVDVQTLSSEMNPFIKVNQGEIAVIGKGLYLPPSGIKVGELASLLKQGYDAIALSEGLFELTRCFKLDYLFINSDTALSEETLLYVALSDMLLLNLRLEQHDFQRVALTLDIASKLSVPNIQLVANWVLPGFDPDDIKQQIEQTFHHPLAGILPFSEDLLAMSGRGIFVHQHPNHILTRAFQAIAALVTAEGAKIRSSVLEEWLQFAAAQRSPAPPAPGLSLFELLSLPDDERQLVNWVIRCGKVTVKGCVEQLGKDEAVVSALLNHLVEQGLLRNVEISGQPYYLPQFSSQQQPLFPDRLWQVLEDDRRNDG